jgi:hypothetical protein
MSWTFLYKGISIEIGELPIPYQNYWKIIDGAIGDRDVHQVFCNTYEDLRLIAMREVDKLLDPNA